MSVDVFSLSCAELEQARLVGFRGVEYISRPYEFQIFFTVPAGTDVRGAVGAKATLAADRGSGREPVKWHGTFVRIRLLRHVAERVLYQGTLVPRLWLLRNCVRSHVHTKENIKKFLCDTLEHGGLLTADYRFHIDEGRYREEEFVCQYRESHLDFFNRWCEREGLYYFFEHSTDDDGQEVLVIVDDKGQNKPLEGKGNVRYFPSGGGDVSSGEGLYEFHCDFQTLPQSVLITDYNYENPAAPVQGEKPVSDTGLGQVRDYGYRVFTEGEANRLAEVKAQSLACRALTIQAAGNAMGLRAGYRFVIDDLGAEELPTEYVAIEVEHAGSLAGMTEELSAYTGLTGNETYAVELHAIPADMQFRALQLTPWPRIYGFENAVIDGEAESQYAQIDEQGRYLVRFKYDASDLKDGSASTYLRMAQPHGGSSEGMHFPLRKGTEVMIAFQGGDPDRPVISGVVPNAQRPSTVTASNHTHNVLRTGGGNYIDMDDKAGEQFIQIHTPKECTQHMGGQNIVGFLGYDGGGPELVKTDYWLYSSGPAGFSVDESWWEDIGGSKNVHAHGPVTIGYDSTHELHIKSDSEEYYHAHRTTITSNGRKDHILADGLDQDIQGGGHSRVKGKWHHKVSAENHDQYGTWKTTSGKWDATFTGAVTLNAGGQTVKLTADHVQIQSNDVTIKGAKIKTEASGFAKYWQPNDFKFFGLKNAIGAEAATVVGLKGDYVQLALSRKAVKIDSSGLKVDHVTAGFKKYGIKDEAKALSLGKGALNVLSFGFTKVG